jgi:hypothetical protein
MAGSLVERFMMAMERQGFVDVVLPFLLIFTIIFAVLQKTQVLGEKKKNFNVVIALVTSLLVIIPHVTNRYPVDADPIIIINNALPQVSLVIVAVIFLLILIGVFGQDKVFLGLAAPGWVMFISLAIIITIFGGAAGWWDGKFERWMTSVFGPDAIAILVMILVFGIVISFITSEPSEEKGMKRLGIDLSKLFESGKH